MAGNDAGRVVETSFTPANVILFVFKSFMFYVALHIPHERGLPNCCSHLAWRFIHAAHCQHVRRGEDCKATPHSTLQTHSKHCIGWSFYLLLIALNWRFWMPLNLLLQSPTSQKLTHLPKAHGKEEKIANLQFVEVPLVLLTRGRESAGMQLQFH